MFRTRFLTQAEPFRCWPLILWIFYETLKRVKFQWKEKSKRSNVFARYNKPDAFFLIPIPYPTPTSQSPHPHFRHNVKYRNFPLISYDVKTGQTRLRNYSHFIDDRFKRKATKSCLFSARLHVIFLEFPLYGLVCLFECILLLSKPGSSWTWNRPGTWEMQAEQDTTKQRIMRPMKKQTNEQEHAEVLTVCLNTKSCCYLFSWTLI